jgi:argininosuccinate lyase
MVAAELGFGRVFENSLDAVSDRDFVAEALFCAALTQVHLSRIGEEIVLWSTEEFGFVRLADALRDRLFDAAAEEEPPTSPSSRVARRAGSSVISPGFSRRSRVCRSRTTAISKRTRSRCSTRSTTCAVVVGRAHRIARNRGVRRHRDDGAADSPINAATDLAEHLVEEGTPFREAHAIVGSLVRQAVERGVPLDELVSNDPRLGPESLGLLEPGSAVRRRTTPGGGGPEPVAVQLGLAKERLERQQTWLAH